MVTKMPRELGRAAALRRRLRRLGAEPWRRRRWLLVLGVMGALLVLWGGAYRYVHNSATFCVSCHAQAKQDVHGGSHGSLSCDECHVVTLVKGVKQQALGWFGKKGASTPHAKVKAGGCRDCHLSRPVSRMQIGDTLGHQQHALEGPRIDCVVCHRASAHNPKPSAEACSGCHKDVKVTEPGMAKVQCLCCHNFLARTTVGSSPVANDCQRCHGGKAAADRSQRFATTEPARAVSEDMVHGSLVTCRLCHNPHKTDPAERIAGKDCRRCHAKVGQDADSLGAPAHADCERCHGVHSRRSEAAQSCQRCHQDHAQGGKTAAERHEQCASCHKPHRFRTEGAVCSSCHQAEAQKVAALPAGVHADCRGCHAPHRAGPVVAACADCHKPMSGNGHPSCLTCHEPHAGTPSGAACTNCHADEQAQLGAARTAHRAGCGSCHGTHAVGGASARCSQCHSAQTTAVSAAPNATHQRCGSCHQPHSFSAGRGGTCRGCHQREASSPHQGDCRQCHNAHGSPVGATPACTKCHNEVPESAARHQPCDRCHEPHSTAKQAVACSSCHPVQVAAAGASGSAAHQLCSGCHQAHVPRATPPCAQCHGDKVASIVGSKHNCRSCHEPHQAKSGAGRCASCHGDKVAATRGRGATHSQCASCHQPHGTAKPNCNGCHSSGSMRGGHTSGGHRACQSCHDTHGQGAAGRTACLGCHKDKTDHYPKAKVCTSCHPFR